MGLFSFDLSVYNSGIDLTYVCGSCSTPAELVSTSPQTQTRYIVGTNHSPTTTSMPSLPHYLEPDYSQARSERESTSSLQAGYALSPPSSAAGPSYTHNPFDFGRSAYPGLSAGLKEGAGHTLVSSHHCYHPSFSSTSISSFSPPNTEIHEHLSATTAESTSSASPCASFSVNSANVSPVSYTSIRSCYPPSTTTAQAFPSFHHHQQSPSRFSKSQALSSGFSFPDLPPVTETSLDRCGGISESGPPEGYQTRYSPVAYPQDRPLQLLSFVDTDDQVVTKSAARWESVQDTCALLEYEAGHQDPGANRPDTGADTKQSPPKGTDLADHFSKSSATISIPFQADVRNNDYVTPPVNTVAETNGSRPEFDLSEEAHLKATRAQQKEHNKSMTRRLSLSDEIAMSTNPVNTFVSSASQNFSGAIPGVVATLNFDTSHDACSKNGIEFHQHEVAQYIHDPTAKDAACVVPLPTGLAAVLPPPTSFEVEALPCASSNTAPPPPIMMQPSYVSQLATYLSEMVVYLWFTPPSAKRSLTFPKPSIAFSRFCNDILLTSRPNSHYCSFVHNVVLMQFIFLQLKSRKAS